LDYGFLHSCIYGLPILINIGPFGCGFSAIPLNLIVYVPDSLSEICKVALHLPFVDGSNLIGIVKSTPCFTVAGLTTNVPCV